MAWLLLDASGIAINRIDHLWEGWEPPPGCSVVADDGRQLYAGGAPSVPASVTRRQAYLALRAAGLFATVDAAILAQRDVSDAGFERWVDWTAAVEFQRGSPTIAAMASALGLSDAQVDALFIDAASR